MAVLITVGFEPPADFPQDSYEAIHRRLEHLASSPQGQIWKQFAGAWNAVAYRFQACAEYDDSFGSDFARFGVNAGGLDRYRQQRDTYGCVANACSVIEAFYYAAYAIGSILLPADFAMTSGPAQRNINPPNTTTQFEHSFATDPFTAALRALADDGDWAVLNDIRNVLIHRAAWAKDVARSAGASATAATDHVRLSDYNLVDVDLAPEFTSGPRKWVAASLKTAIEAADAFTTAQFP